MSKIIIAELSGETVQVLNAFDASDRKIATVKLPHFVTMISHGGPYETDVIHVQAAALKNIREVEAEDDGDF